MLDFGKNKDKLKGNPEFTQAVIRLAIWLTITLLIWIQFSGELENLQTRSYFIFMVSFLIIAVIFILSVLIIPSSKIRPYITTPFDLGAISYTMILTNAGPFSVYYLLYTWVFVGYGTRYGRGPLFSAVAMSLIGYLYVLWLFDSWSQSLFSSAIYTFFLILLPMYINKMISKIKQSQQEAITANKDKSDFLAAMSHEIRTPMSGIIGMTSLLEKTKLDQTQSEYVSTLQQSSTALHSLINDILDISKIEAGKTTLQISKFNLSKLIYGVVQIFTPVANAKGLELINYIQSDIPCIVEGDPDKLRQVLLNLISNAVKFTDFGEVSLKTTMVETKADEKVRIKIEVTDTGLGIPNQQLEKIFEPFYQGKNISQSKHSGTGLGTTISHELTTLMNGEIAACSDLDKGSVFWIELPYNYCEYQNENLSLPHPDASNIIVLDDIISSAYATKSYLNSLQINPIMATDEDSVLKSITNLSNDNKITIILTESNSSPDRSEFAKKIKDNYAKSIFLVLITNIEKIETIKNDFDDLYDDFIIRPFDVFRLKQVIASLYSGKKLPLNELTEEINETPKLNKIHSILIAEDSDINAKVICTFLEQEGHKTTRVITGAAAIEELIKTKYDFIFMDMHMPEMDGLEATRQWRQQNLETNSIQSDVDIPIVALTANATTEDKESCLDAGMNKFLSKPVSKDKMLEVMDELIK